MPGAARMNDFTDHPGTITGGLPTVLIEGSAAARATDAHTCTFPPPGGPHGLNAILKGSSTVFIGKLPAARKDDPCACGAKITTAAMTVNIGG